MVDTLNLNLVPDDSEEEFIVDFGEVINVGGGGTSDFNELTNRPKYDGQTMTGDTDIPKVPTTTSDLENTSDYQTGTEVQTAIDTAIAGKQDKLTAGNAITIDENNVIGADIYPADYFTAGGTVTGSGSSFTLDKTIPATLKSVKVDGNTEQDGTPSPSSPVDVDVVTGTQTVLINGKNLMMYDVADMTNTRQVDITNLALSAGTYTISFDLDSFVLGTNTTFYVNMMLKNSSGETLVDPKIITLNESTTLERYSYAFTITSAAVPSASANIRIPISLWNNGARAKLSNIQIERGSTATDYEAYQSQTFTLNLGSYEFCKIGDYQDYIYKSGDNWYWHKEIDKVALGSLTWSPDSTNQTGIYRMSTNDLSGLFAPPRAISVAFTGLSTHFVSVPANSSGTYGAHEGISANATGVAMQIYHSDYNTNTSETAFTTWLTNNDVLLYYALKEPGDIVLGGTLKQQLDALAEARSYLDVTNFIVTTTGTNLPIILDVEALRNSADGVALREPKVPEVIDTLDSTDTKNALSANMGHVLNESISNVQEAVYDAYDIRYITGDMEPNWPEEEPDGFRIEIFEPNRIYYTDASAPVKIYYSDTDSIDNFIGYIQNEMVEDNPEDEPPTTTYGFKFTQMNGADSTPEIYVGQSSMNWNDNELTSLSFEQVGAGGGGSPYNVYSTVTTSNSNRGGAIYLGNLNASQEQFADPTTSDTHKRYIHILPYSNTTQPASNSIILGSELTSSTATGGIGLGFSASVEASNVINIGGQYGRGQYNVIIGSSASSQRSDSQYNVLLGYSSTINISAVNGSVGIGAYSHPTASGQIHVGSTNTSFGYNNTNYRIISGVHDGQDLNDAATVAQGNTLATSAPTTSTVGVLGQLYTDTTTMHTYQLGAIDNTDPSNPVYTWVQRW